jgi:hypothetical protein
VLTPHPSSPATPTLSKSVRYGRLWCHSHVPCCETDALEWPATACIMPMHPVEHTTRQPPHSPHILPHRPRRPHPTRSAMAGHADMALGGKWRQLPARCPCVPVWHGAHGSHPTHSTFSLTSHTDPVQLSPPWRLMLRRPWAETKTINPGWHATRQRQPLHGQTKGAFTGNSVACTLAAVAFALCATAANAGTAGTAWGMMP